MTSITSDMKRKSGQQAGRSAKKVSAATAQGCVPVTRAPSKDEAAGVDEESNYLMYNSLKPTPRPDVPAADADVFSELGAFDVEPFVLGDSYFKEGHSSTERLVRHQLESFNHFIQFQLHQMVDDLSPVVCHSDVELIPDTFPHAPKYLTEVTVRFSKVRCQLPIMYETDGTSKPMYPNEARLRNFTYASSVTVQVNAHIVVRDKNGVVTRELDSQLDGIQFISDLPVMVNSCLCTLRQTPVAPSSGECEMDPGGYYIVKGSEKVVIAQERKAENRVSCFDASNTKHYLFAAEINSVPDGRCSAPKQAELFILRRNNGHGHPITVAIPKLKPKHHVNLFVLFRAMGVLSDRDICRHILYNVDDIHQADTHEYLMASMHEASDIRTQDEAFKSILGMVNYNNRPFGYGRGYGPDTRTEEEKVRDQLHAVWEKREYTKDLLENGIFLHCRSPQQSLYFLGYMVRRLLNVAMGIERPTNRDSGEEKKVDITGTTILNNVRAHAQRAIKEFQRHLCREIKSGTWRSSSDYSAILTHVNIDSMLRPSTIRNGITRALSRGDFSTKQTSSKDGVAQLLNRVTLMGMLAHLRKINTPTDKQSGEMLEPRKFNNTLHGMVCPAETPESRSVGLVKAMALLAIVTIASDSSSLRELVVPWILSLESSEMAPERAHRATKVFINGAWVGVVVEHSPMDMYRAFKEMKQTGAISIHTSVIFDVGRNEIRLGTEGGRLSWPLLRVRDGKVLLTSAHVDALKRGELCWSDLLTNSRLPESVIEYLDAEETTFQLLTTKNYRETRATVPWIEAQHYKHVTYAEIHPVYTHGLLASAIPFPENNPSTRNIYQTSMAKAAIGTYCTNYEQRMDRSAHILNFPTRKLVDTPAMASLGLDKYPAGEMVTLAVMCMDGYNQEDSQYLNAGSVARGMFLTTMYSTDKDEDKSVVRDEVNRCRPNPLNTRGIRKADDYSRLNVHGVLNKNTEVNKGTVFMSKSTPIKGATVSGVKGDGIRFENHSMVYRGREQAFVQHNYVGRNGEGINVGKTTLRTLRPPVICDKFAPEDAQKGVAGFITPQEDMPFTASGRTPDIIMNPHAFPSRMTYSQLKMTLAGKLMVSLGYYLDGSAFQRPLDMSDLETRLMEHGFESQGYDVLYDAATGHPLPVKIFMGPLFYQRLKHMVEDKVHTRDHGQMMTLTRQPGEGRSRAGGFKFGEMEVHVLWAHGATEAVMDRMFHASDAYGVYVCRACGMMAVGNNGLDNNPNIPALKDFKVYNCRACNNSSDMAYVNIPYSGKLLFQELRTSGIIPRILVE